MNSSIRYVSTRGQGEPIGFADVVLAGLAPDGGLYVPTEWPRLDRDTLGDLAGRPYTEIAYKVISLFTGEDLSATALRSMIDAAYGRFEHPAVTPLIQVGADDFLLELHHGPTLAFKDVAMQFLGHLFAAQLAERGQQMTIVAATSGDTGGAAIDAMAGRPGINICVLHPHGRISEVQRRFMTTVAADNVLNIAVEGTFDDCQSAVKAMFADDEFRTRISLGAVNSINWARIIAQTVYYVSVSLALSRNGAAVSFCVPTGNFGDIFAGYVAKQLGAPIGRLVIATNENDILSRALNEGAYRPDGVVATQSPSMDIQISSNFERLLYLATGRKTDEVVAMMAALRAGEGFSLTDDMRSIIAQDFSAYRADEAETSEMIATIFRKTGQLVDPHTAVGLVAAEKARSSDEIDGPLVTLSTAHPAKFPDAVEAACGIKPALPARCRDLYATDEALLVAPNELDTLKGLIIEKFAASA